MADLKQKGLVVLTNAGGVGVITVDNLAKTSLSLAEISPQTKTKLQVFLPPASSTHNPIDVLGDATSIRYKQSLEVLALEENVELILVLVTPQLMTDLENLAKVVVEFAKTHLQIPTVAVFIGGRIMAGVNEIFDKHEIVFYDTPEQAIVALDKFYKYSKNLKNTSSNEDLATEFTNFKNQKASEILKINQLIEKAKKAGSKSLDFETVELIARTFSLHTPKFEFIEKLDLENGKILKLLEENNQKNSSVLKVVAGDILHRTEGGMVKIKVQEIGEVAEFLEKNASYLDKKNSLILQQMAVSGVEFFVGVKNDEQFGPTLVLGTGGIFAEVYEDFTLAPIPISKSEISESLKLTKINKILTGFRGLKLDVESLVKTIYNLSLIPQIFPQIESLDVNPIIVYPENQGNIVVDLKIVV